jgi:uncharacterized protein (TIGR02145 family)
VYGGLYLWDEMMDYTASSNSNPSGRQGICPPGWHVPSDAEWSQMETHIATTLIYGSASPGVGGSLKETGTIHWASPNEGAPHSTGFTGLPGGHRLYNETGFSGKTTYGFWWTTFEKLDNESYYRSLIYNFSFLSRSNVYKTDGMSLRCAKDL